MKAILVVDDSPIIRSVIQLHLDEERFDVLEAGSVDQAVRILRERKIDLVITDVRLPGADGLELVRRVRGPLAMALGPLPIIVMTSDWTDESRAGALAAGANETFEKPISAGKLTELVTKLSGG